MEIDFFKQKILLFSIINKEVNYEGSYYWSRSIWYYCRFKSK